MSEDFRGVDTRSPSGPLFSQEPRLSQIRQIATRLALAYLGGLNLQVAHHLIGGGITGDTQTNRR